MRMRLKLLDLFCGVGGGADGYFMAGFDDIVGVDNRNQPRYPYDFVKSDVFRFLANTDLSSFDAIHASPPCQKYSVLARTHKHIKHDDLIPETRQWLMSLGKPYVIENVEGAPLFNPKTICGTERGLGINGYRLRRHRWFETNFDMVTPPCKCGGDKRPVIFVAGGGPTYATTGYGKQKTYCAKAEEARRVMGISWATRYEVAQAIPPAYTQLIGKHIITLLWGTVYDREVTAKKRERVNA
jgi:DNA (cytosine-5)-methyltransferase 1